MIGYELFPTVYVENVCKITELINANKVKSILLLTSPTPYKYLLENLITSLSDQFDLDVFKSIKQNTPIEQLEVIKSDYNKPDLILAVGGGSVIDAAKALSVCWNSDSISDVFYKRESIKGEKIPVFAVPSTAGTGAELSYGAILEDASNGLKGGVRGPEVQPNNVLIDIDLYKLAPSKLKAEVGFDNLTHAIETYVSKKSSAIVRYQSIAAIKTIFENIEDAVFKSDREAIEQMAISASFMGINLAKSSTCLPHRIQYVIGPKTDTTHAQGLIMLYNGWLPIIKETKEFESLANAMSMDQYKLAAKIESVRSRLSLNYRLSDYGIGDEHVDELALKVTGACENDPCYQGLETIKEIIIGSI